MATASKFILRHLVASLVSVIAPTAIGSLLYFGLLVIAIVFDKGIGSPIALPLWVVIGLFICTAYTAFLLFPSVCVAEGISRIFGKWQLISQIPLATVTLGIFIWFITALVKSLPNSSDSQILQLAEHPIEIFLVLSLPLGLYWWIAKIVQVSGSVPSFVFRKLEIAIRSRN